RRPRDGDPRRGARPRDGGPPRLPRGRQAGGRRGRLPGRPAPPSPVRPRLAPRLRGEGRGRPGRGHRGPSRHAGPQGPHHGRGRGDPRRRSHARQGRGERQEMKRPASAPWAGLLTESRNPRSERLDALPTPRVVALLLDEDRRALVAALGQRAAIARAADLVADALEGGGRIVFLGAGTSGRLGVLEAAECPPTFGTDPDRIRAVMAGGEDAVFRAVEGAEDREDEGREEAQRLRTGDVLIGISASSVTPFVRGGLETARARGLHTVLVTCAPRPGLRAMADVVIA